VRTHARDDVSIVRYACQEPAEHIILAQCIAPRGDEHIYLVLRQLEPRRHRVKFLETLRAKLVEGNLANKELYVTTVPARQRSAQFLNAGR